jgi:hypothetical protein
MEVKFEPRTDCVFATITGPMAPERLLPIFYKIIDAAVERGLGLILVDFSALVPQALDWLGILQANSD